MKRFFSLSKLCAALALTAILAFSFAAPAARAQNAVTGSVTGALPPYLTFAPPEASLLLKADTAFVVLDVRTSWEYANAFGHLPNAVLLPFDELETRLEELSAYKSRPIMVYCHSGARSKRACELLAQRGFLTYLIEGGIKAWNAARLPVVKRAMQNLVKKH